MDRPHTVEQVLKWVEEGRLPPVEAFTYLMELEKTGGTPGQAPGNGQSAGISHVAKAAQVTRAAEVARTAQVEEALQELEALIGLSEVKRLVRELYAFVEIQRRRAQYHLATEPMVLHMIFKGNPGTGKTTVARILGKIFREMGVLQKGHLVEVERADLVGEYIGHTAQKTREQLRRAMGGILFIDEAYSLARGGEKDFGKEAIDTFVKAMEDHKEDIILILAGYRREMEYFLRTNPGLRSRFPIHIDFPDYSREELLAIADLMLRRRQYQLSKEARIFLAENLEKPGREDAENSGNARLVRNVIEKAIRRQAVRLMRNGEAGRDELILIAQEDIAEALEGP